MFSPEDISALWVTMRLAATTTGILLMLGTPLAWWLARSRFKGKMIIEAMVALPLILPPTVLGFYLLVLLEPNGMVGRISDFLGGPSLVFSFTGLVIGSVIYSLPFAVQPLQNSFAAMGQRPLEVAATLGAGPVDRFFTIAVPLARRGFISAATLAFAHTVGEFGVILMVGGNIPGKTRVLSTAIYDYTEAMQYEQAGHLSGGLLIFSFLLLVGLALLNKRFETVSP